MILLLFLFFLFFPLNAWAYFDPGFGGYLINSIISLILTGLAFVSAAFIYFFRTIIGQKLFPIWQRHKILCRTVLLSALGSVLLYAWYILLLSTLGVKGRYVLGAFLHRLFFFQLIKLEIIPYYLMEKAFVDPDFDRYLSIFLILLTVISFAFLGTVIICFFPALIGQRPLTFWKDLRKLSFITLLSVLCLGSVSLLPFFRAYNDQSIYLSRMVGIHILDFQRMSKGYNLTEGKLIDEKGRTVKQWSRKYLGVIDANGDYYAQQHWRAPLWGRYSWNNKIIWQKHFLIHHEIYLSPQGTIFTFTKETHRYNNNKVDFDVILEFDKNGKELQRYSFFDHLKEFQPYHKEFTIDSPFPVLRPFMSLWQKTFHQGTYDYFHLNSIFMVPPNPLEGKNPAFRPGNWLISIFHGSMVFILDQDTKKILWHAVANEVEGGLEGQHSVSMLPDGNILIFDNGISRLASRALIIDPLTLKTKWQYTNKDFFSETEGFIQALPNGNFLITESNKNHAFEVTRDKKIVWDYYDTANKDDDIYRMTRYPKAMIDGLLRKEGAH